MTMDYVRQRERVFQAALMVPIEDDDSQKMIESMIDATQKQLSRAANHLATRQMAQCCALLACFSVLLEQIKAGKLTKSAMGLIYQWNLALDICEKKAREERE